MSKSKSKPSIQCDKCRKWIKYNYSHGYGHYCSGRAKEIRKVAYIKFCHINSIQNRDPRFFRVRDLANDLDSASAVHSSRANKLSRIGC